MTIKAVTTAQLEQVRKMAKEKSVGRDEFQRGLDDGSIAVVLDSLKIDGEARKSELVPPAGGRVCVVRVPVQFDREWQEAINAAGPNTPDDYNVRKVGDQYPPAGNGTVETEIILMNFGSNGGSWDKAIAWANQNRLKRTNPRQVFAIGEHKPGLNRELKRRDGHRCIRLRSRTGRFHPP